MNGDSTDLGSSLKRKANRITIQGQEEDTTDTGKKSNTLSSIFRGGNTTRQQFFQEIWQRHAKYFPFSGDNANLSPSDGTWRDDEMNEYPLEEILNNGWFVVQKILEQAEEKCKEDENFVPLIFHNRKLKDPNEIKSLYGKSLFAPYLDGCSVVLNHGDLLSPWISKLCLDLQNEFPHAYANCYLTPPNSQAVPPHADDRDVSKE